MVLRKLLVGLAIGAVTIVGYVGFTATSAHAQDLCDLLGDPYCPDSGGGGVITCPTAVVPGATGTCTVSGVNVGDSIVARLECTNGYSATLFSGTATASSFTFDFTIPSDAPSSGCSIILSQGSANLARTGTDVGPLLGVGGALVSLGIAAALAARRRLRNFSAV